MKNQLLYLIFLLSFSTNIFCQKTLKPFEISLKDQTLRGVYFDFEIIDLRERTDFLGNIYKTVSNRLMPSKLENGAVFQFQDLIKRSNTNNIETKDSFALVIKEMVVLEEYDPDQASLNVFFEFYQIKNGQYFKVHEYDGFDFYQGNFIHKFHAEKIAKVLQDAVVEFQLYFNSKLLPELENGFSNEELLNQKVVYNYEILKKSEYKKGFYRTYAEFLNNTPSNQEEFKIIFKSGKIQNTNLYRYSLFHFENKKDLSDKEKQDFLNKFWGFSDGFNLYLNNVNFNNGQFFSLIESKGEYCYFHSIDKSSRNFYFSLIGGVTGYFISKNIKSNHQGPFIFDIKNLNTFPVSVPRMGLMLRSDLETVKAYKGERRRGKKSIQFKYIDMYNEKNRDKFIEEMTKSKN